MLFSMHMFQMSCYNVRKHICLFRYKSMWNTCAPMPLQDTLQDLFGDSRHRDLLCCIQPLWQLVLVQRGFIWKATARTLACVEKCLRLMRLAAACYKLKLAQVQKYFSIWQNNLFAWNWLKRKGLVQQLVICACHGLCSRQLWLSWIAT